MRSSDEVLLPSSISLYFTSTSIYVCSTQLHAAVFTLNKSYTATMRPSFSLALYFLFGALFLGGGRGGGVRLSYCDSAILPLAKLGLSVFPPVGEKLCSAKVLIIKHLS